MSQLPRDEQFELLAAGYFDEVLDDAGQAALKALLHEDDRRIKRFAQLAQLNQMIASEIAYAKQAQRFDLNRTPHDSAVALAMAELLGNYEDGLDTPVDFATWRDEQASQAQTRRRHRMWTRTLIGGAVAALLVLAGVLAVVLIGDDAPKTQVAEREEVAPKRAVATLTDVQNAQWMEGAFAAGDRLRAGQRLSLVEGFAQITTHQGAVAILQAPCTVELTDSDNALRLHAGKLVGICETESSKGFVVRTPHMDITDLGTRFGVAIDEAGNALAEVFMGSIQVTPNETSGADFQTQRMTRGQAFAIDQDGGQTPRESFKSDTFAKLNAVQAETPQAISGFRWVQKDWFVGRVQADWPTSKDTFVFEELRNYRLQDDLAVTLHDTGISHRSFNANQPSTTIPRGTVIRTYIVLLNPGETPELITSRGSIDFEGEILGLITSRYHWNLFTQSAPNSGESLIELTSSHSLLEDLSGRPAEIADEIVLAGDGKTLRYKLVTEGFTDLVRVIVREPAGETGHE